MRCKFCGCSEERACLIPCVTTGDGEFRIALLNEVAHFTTSCAWISTAPEICSAPECVRRAYEEINGALDRALELAA